MPKSEDIEEMFKLHNEAKNNGQAMAKVNNIINGVRNGVPVNILIVPALGEPVNVGHVYEYILQDIHTMLMHDLDEMKFKINEIFKRMMQEVKEDDEDDTVK